MQGTFVHGSRPKTKKALKEIVEAIEVIPVTAHPSSSEDIVRSVSGHTHDGYCVVIEATSMFGNEYDGSLANAPKGARFNVVGPDPHTSRKWYATISFNNQKGRWEVK